MKVIHNNGAIPRGVVAWIRMRVEWTLQLHNHNRAVMDDRKWAVPAFSRPEVCYFQMCGSQQAVHYL